MSSYMNFLKFRTFGSAPYWENNVFKYQFLNFNEFKLL